MKHEVPFRRQESEYDCGPAALRMATAFLGDEKSSELIREALDYEDGEAVYTIELATAASELGFQASFFTADPWAEHESEFHEKHGRDFSNEELYESAEEAGVEVDFQELELDEVIDFLGESSIPVVLVDWHVVTGEEGYQGHFLPIVGTTPEKVIVHEPSDEDGDYKEIDRDIFDKARKAEGTDQDVAVIKKSDG